MADNVAITAGSGTTIAADDIGGAMHQRVKLTIGADGTANDVSAGAGAVGTGTLRATLASDDPAVVSLGLLDDAIFADDAAFTPATSKVNAAGLMFDDVAPDSVDEGDIGIGRMSANRNAYTTIRDAAGNERGVNVTAGNRLTTDSAIASGGIASGAIASGAIAAGAIAAGATSIADNEDVASADGDRGVKVLAVRKATPANTSGTDGDYEFPQMSGGYLWVHDNKGLSNLAFSAAFTTLTRPANTTVYSALDSISDNGTAASVTALSATLSDVNDDPIFVSDILVSSTDTGLAGKRVRAYLFNSDPTTSSGVGNGDNAAYSQKKAGYIGSFSGVLETGFSDGTVGRLVPTFADGTVAPGPHGAAGGFVVTKPTSSAKTLYIQYQAVDAFTPSANSTTIIGTARGWQGRAV